MESQWFEAEVIGKTTEQRGLIFKSTAYIIAVRFTDYKSQTGSCETSFDRYCSVKVGELIRIEMYRTNKGTWAAPKEYAEYLNKLR